MEKKKWTTKVQKKTLDISWTEKLQRESISRHTFKVQGKDSTGREAYYFIHIPDEAKRKAFLQQKVGDTYSLDSYGTVIYSAYGTHVPKHVCEMLSEKYGFDNFGPQEEEDDNGTIDVTDLLQLFESQND